MTKLVTDKQTQAKSNFHNNFTPNPGFEHNNLCNIYIMSVD